MTTALRNLGHTHAAWDALVSASRIRVSGRGDERCAALVEIVASSMLRQMGHVKASHAYSRSALKLASRGKDEEILRVAVLTHVETVQRLLQGSRATYLLSEARELLDQESRLWRGVHRGRIRTNQGGQLLLLGKVREAREQFDIAH